MFDIDRLIISYREYFELKKKEEVINLLSILKQIEVEKE